MMPGDLVVVEEDSPSFSQVGNANNWWLGHVVHVTCGARDHQLNSIFQIADIDTGRIRTINSNLVKAILRPKSQDV